MYQNKSIDHILFFRCPKKIVTADGETIVKKRTRGGNNASNAKV